MLITLITMVMAVLVCFLTLTASYYYSVLQELTQEDV